MIVSIPGRDLGVLEQPQLKTEPSRADPFQSLEGIWGFWNNPLKLLKRTIHRFQSLEGIWGFWNFVSLSLLPTSTVFQSLEGIWGFWNPAVIAGSRRSPMFQSLEGIWGFWNRTGLTRKVMSSSVSIPGRDLGVLELRGRSR